VDHLLFETDVFFFQVVDVPGVSHVEGVPIIILGVLFLLLFSVPLHAPLSFFVVVHYSLLLAGMPLRSAFGFQVDVHS